MKTKTMYVADDGSVFDTMQKCIVYENSVNKYTVFVLSEKGIWNKQEFDSEAKAKHFIADTLHHCFNNGFTGIIKLLHLGKVLEFKSTELSEVVPAHLKINGEKLNDIFQKAKMRNIL